MRTASTVAALGACLALAACNESAAPSATESLSPAPAVVTTTASAPPVTATRSPRAKPRPRATPSPTPAARSHVGARLAPQPPFRWGTSTVTAAQLGGSWHSGCPVGPSALRNLRLTFWGFDGRAHTGALVVNSATVSAYVAAFRSMYAARFPFRRMQPISAYGGSDDKSMAADNTSAFNCRAAVSNGPKHWSMHAYGRAVDLNPVENPYVLDGKVTPPQGRRYTNRSNVRPGMVVRGSAPVRAFSAVGWGWGGYWSSSKDYQHFSSNGR
jgi:hypothetical protein